MAAPAISKKDQTLLHNFEQTLIGDHNRKRDVHYKTVLFGHTFVYLNSIHGLEKFKCLLVRIVSDSIFWLFTTSWEKNTASLNKQVAEVSAKNESVAKKVEELKAKYPPNPKKTDVLNENAKLKKEIEETNAKNLAELERVKAELEAGKTSLADADIQKLISENKVVPLDHHQSLLEKAKAEFEAFKAALSAEEQKIADKVLKRQVRAEKKAQKADATEAKVAETAAPVATAPAPAAPAKKTGIWDSAKHALGLDKKHADPKPAATPAIGTTPVATT